MEPKARNHQPRTRVPEAASDGVAKSKSARTVRKPRRGALPAKTKLMLLSPLGERLGEGVMQETFFGLTPSPNLSPKGERNMNDETRPSAPSRVR